MAPFIIRKLTSFKSTEDDRPWGLYERVAPQSEYKPIKLVSRHKTRAEAREALRQLMQEERRHGSPD